jgi:beta-lactamase regulating signal transducer with metallopeptidase domain
MSGAVLALLAEASVRATLAAAIVAVALAALRVRSSSARHAAWSAVMAAMIAMPLLSRVMPPLAVPLTVPAFQNIEPNAAEAPHGVGEIDAPTALFSERREAPLSGQMPAGSPGTTVSVARVATRGAGWQDLAAALYAFVVAALLARLILGWLAAARLVRSSVVVSIASDYIVRQCAALAAPATVGLATPMILLPPVWRSWPLATLRAVVAHETAHARRRDPVVNLLARANRCVFWFHPLAWWLERTITDSAEEACDAQAMSVCEDPPAYVDVLVAMARQVEAAGGRVRWVPNGISGSGRFERRIARALGAAPASLTKRGAAALTAACAAAIVLAAACRTAPPSAQGHNATALARDRALRTMLVQLVEREWRDVSGADWDAGPAPVAALEREARANPDDLDALRRFLVAYWAQYAPTAGVVQNPLIRDRIVDARLQAARRDHLLELIAHHPDSELTGSVIARIFPVDLEPFFPGDPGGFAQARVLWLAYAGRPQPSAVALSNAARFFEATDKPLAETLLVRARAVEPAGGSTAALGRLYAIALVGSMAVAGRNAARVTSAPDPRGAFGLHARQILAESSDDALVTAAGWFIERAGVARPGIDFDPRFWAESCFRRALEINPQGVLAHALLLDVAAAQRMSREPLWRVPPDALDARLTSLPDAERFRQLPERARVSFRSLVDMSRWDDPTMLDRQASAYERAKRYAEQALALAPRFRDDPGYGTAIYTANMTLSAVALRDDDVRTAVARLLAASNAPPTEALVYGDDVVSRWRSLLTGLADRGERPAVSQFLDRMRRVNLADDTSYF